MQINQLVKTLLQKETLEQCSLQELEKFADRHPYFGAAQLLLTKKLQAENPERYDEQLQKTLLFFHNPMWVEHLLNETGNATIIAAEKKEELTVEPALPHDSMTIQPEEQVGSVPEEIVETRSAIFIAPEIRLDALPEHKQPEPSQLEQITELKAAPVADSAETVIKIDAGPPPAPDMSASPDEPLMKIPGLKMDTIDPAKAELVFDPYHTVDYFASQGIKFKEEEKPKDKFGQQLKSFTDWLKTMKRLSVSEIATAVESNPGLSVRAEQKVEQLAEKSISDREIVTETMAEVWEKQGNIGKAIGIYNKLSLLEPSKSLYFAAKIEELKKIN